MSLKKRIARLAAALPPKGPSFRESHRRLAALVSLAGMTVPSVAFAAPGWTSAQRVTQVIVADTFTVAIVSSIDNPVSCTSPTWLRIEKDDSNFAPMTAAILSAQAQGKTAQFYAMSCNADGSVHITGVWIQQQ